MGTLNTERLRELPPAIGEVANCYGKQLPGAVDEILTIAQETDVEKFIQSAKQYETCVAKLKDMVMSVIGKEDDTLTDAGTIWAAHAAGEKIERAMGVG